MMPETLLEEGYVMLVSYYYQQMHFCHFCQDYCVHATILSSTCDLKYAMPSLQGCMPCIFVISVVTSTRMQSSLLNVADFRDLEIF